MKNLIAIFVLFSASLSFAGGLSDAVTGLATSSIVKAGTPLGHVSFGIETNSGFVQVIKTDPMGYESEFGPFIGYVVTCVGNFTPNKDAIWVYTVENCNINN